MNEYYDLVTEQGLKRAELWGIRDCSNDASEGVPFSSVGGLSRRSDFFFPEYVPHMYREAYAKGYAGEAERIYGADWKTAPFEWARSLEVPAADGSGFGVRGSGQIGSGSESVSGPHPTPQTSNPHLDAAPARVLTTREMAKILSSLVTGLCEWNAVVDVRATVRWLHENEEFWRVQCMSREALEAYVLAAVARPAPVAAEEPTA